MAETRFVDETDWGFGWFSPEKPGLRMASHALVANGRVWVIDPNEADGVDDRIRAVGEPAGVIQLLDRHNRACAAFAKRHGVRRHVVPFDGIPDSPFEVARVMRRRRWHEVALWWPERRVLVCADALGTVPHYYAVGDDPIGPHLMLRLTPPRQLGRFDAAHVLCGHGEGIHENAAEAVRESLRRSSRRIPRLVFELPLAFRP